MAIKDFFSHIFTRAKTQERKRKDGQTHTVQKAEEDSPISAFIKRQALTGALYSGEASFGDAFADECERQEAMRAVFPRPPTNWGLPADPSQIFLTPSNEPALAGRMHDSFALDETPTGASRAPSAQQNARAVHHGDISNGSLAGFGYDPLRKYGINERVLKHYQNRCFITWNSCALIAGHELVMPACSIPAEDAMAHGYHVVCTSPSHEAGEKHEASETDFLKQIKLASDKMGINDLCVKLVTKKHIFGVIMAIPVMVVTDEEGHEIPGEKFDYTQEYNPSKITKNSYKGFAVVEPQWLTYEFDSASSMDATSLHFYTPTYIVKPDGTKIHRSWVIRLINKEVCDILKPTYYFGGLSLTQMLYERMWCADKIANEAPLLAMTKRLLIADGNLEQLIMEPRKANVFFKAINYFRDNWSVFVKKPSSQVQQIDTSLSDLTPLTMSQYQLVAAIAQIPVTKLMKNVPSGLQSTGQYEWDDYAQKLIGIQQKDIKPFLERHLELFCRSHYWADGHQRTDLELSVEFDPIDLPKQQEKTQQASQQVQTAATLVGNGIATVAEARAFLRKTGNTFFDGIAPEVPKLLQKIEDAKDPEKQQQMMGGGIMGGGMGSQGGTGSQDPNEAQNQQGDQAFTNAIQTVLKGEEGAQEGAQEGTQEGTEGSEHTGKEEGANATEGTEGPFESILKRLGGEADESTSEHDLTPSTEEHGPFEKILYDVRKKYAEEEDNT